MSLVKSHGGDGENNMIGYIGLGLLLLGYVFLVTNKESWFAPNNTVASLLLCIHAVMLHDIPFIIVNGFVAVLLAVKTYKQYKLSCHK